MFIIHSRFLYMALFSILKGYSKFNNSIFYNAVLSSKKNVAPFSGLLNHCRHWKVQEVILGDLMKGNISHWLSLSELDLKQEWEKQEALIWEAKKKNWKSRKTAERVLNCVPCFYMEVFNWYYWVGDWLFSFTLCKEMYNSK